jgi:hypothetical protein
MNKKINILKIILTLLLIFLNIKYISIYGLTSISILIYLVLISILLILFIKDLINKTMINKTYDILFIIVETIISLIFIRTLYDPSFIYNSNYYTNLLGEFNNYHFGLDISDIQYINLLYLDQNIWYFILLLILLLSYRKINMPKKESKYHIVSLICFVISICTVIPSIVCLTSYSHNIIFYLIFNIILVVVEIYRLIKDNHVKKEWIIFLSFFFNLFAFISIFINLM